MDIPSFPFLLIAMSLRLNNKTAQSIVMMELPRANNISSPVSPKASICFIKRQSIYFFFSKSAPAGETNLQIII